MGRPYSIGEEYCNFPCSGDGRQMCGGLGYMNLFWLRSTPWDDDHDKKPSDRSYDPSHRLHTEEWESWDSVGCFKYAEPTSLHHENPSCAD